MAKPKTDKGVTLIAVNASIEGNICFAGELYVNGSIVGDIAGEDGAEATLVVSEEGAVKGEIRVTDAIIDGTVDGDVRADVRAELGKKARMRGDLYYKLVEVHNGAVIDGRMVPQDGADTHAHQIASPPSAQEGLDGITDDS